MKKQDIAGVRQAKDLEQKYDFSLLEKMKGKGSGSIDVSQIQQQLTQFMVDMNGRMAVLENKVYPIGSFYISTDDTDPTTIFGGEWEFYTEGHLLIGLETEENAPSEMLQISDKSYVWKRIA